MFLVPFSMAFTIFRFLSFARPFGGASDFVFIWHIVVPCALSSPEIDYDVINPILFRRETTVSSALQFQWNLCEFKKLAANKYLSDDWLNTKQAGHKVSEWVNTTITTTTTGIYYMAILLTRPNGQVRALFRVTMCVKIRTYVLSNHNNRLDLLPLIVVAVCRYWLFTIRRLKRPIFIIVFEPCTLLNEIETIPSRNVHATHTVLAYRILETRQE